MERRTFLGVLAAAGLLGLSGCTSTASTPVPSGRSTTPAAPPSADEELRRATADAEQRLITAYTAAIATADPAIAERLGVIQAQHVEHAQRLFPDREVTTAPPGQPASEAEDSSGPVAPTAAVPTESAAASPSPLRPRVLLAGLRQAELAALDQRQAACAQAASPELVRSLCLIAASEAQHADVLAALTAELPR